MSAQTYRREVATAPVVEEGKKVIYVQGPILGFEAWFLGMRWCASDRAFRYTGAPYMPRWAWTRKRAIRKAVKLGARKERGESYWLSQDDPPVERVTL